MPSVKYTNPARGVGHAKFWNTCLVGAVPTCLFIYLIGGEYEVSEMWVEYNSAKSHAIWHTGSGTLSSVWRDGGKKGENMSTAVDCRICGDAIGVLAIKYTDGCCSQECLKKAFPPPDPSQCNNCDGKAVMLNVYHDGKSINLCKECLRSHEKCFCKFDDEVLDDEYYCCTCDDSSRTHENKKRYWKKYPHMKAHDLAKLEETPAWLYPLKYKEIFGEEKEKSG